jgi:hypothetical protein
MQINNLITKKKINQMQKNRLLELKRVNFSNTSVQQEAHIDREQT